MSVYFAVKKNSILIILLSVYVACQALNYFSFALVTDERLFLVDAQKLYAKLSGSSLVWHYAEIPNHLNYGSLYWLIQIACLKISGTFLKAYGFDYLPIRTIAFVCTISIPIVTVLLALRRKVARAGIYAYLLIYLFMPMNWWTGKISGPETFSQFFSLVGLSLLLLGEGWWILTFSGVLLGVGAGIKLTAMPVLVYGLIVLLINKNIKRSIVVLLSGLAGFVMANPYLFKNPQAYLVAAEKPISYFNQLKNVWMSNAWDWDSVFVGGLNYWGLNLVAMLVAGLLIFWNVKRSYAVALAIAMVMGHMMLLTNARFLGWYGFPLLALIPMTMLFFDNNKIDIIPSKKYYFCIALLLMVNSVTALPVMYRNFKLKWDMHVLMANKNSITQEVLRHLDINSDKDILLVDLSDSPSLIYNTIIVSSNKFNGTRYGGYDAFNWLCSLPAYENELKAITNDVNVIVVLGERVTRYNKAASYYFNSKSDATRTWKKEYMLDNGKIKLYRF